MFPFIPLILSKVNSYEDSVTGKFKSPVPNFGAVCLQFLLFLEKHKGLFLRMHFSEQAHNNPPTYVNRSWGVTKQRRKTRSTIQTYVQLNIYTNNNCNNLFVNSIVNYAIHNHFHFQLQVKTTPGKLQSRSWDNFLKNQTLINESLASCKNQISVVWDFLLLLTKNALYEGIKTYVQIEKILALLY